MGFAFYSDDSVIWSDSYNDVVRAVGVLDDSVREMEVSFNLPKSPGIRLLTSADAKAEITKINSVSFVGYEIGNHKISIKDSLVRRAKSRLNYLVYSNLLKEPLNGNINSMRLKPALDLDYLVMINQIRRYLYGGLTESMLKRYLARAAPRIRYQGFMSFFPIVDDGALLRELDGWLVHTVFTALRLRTKCFSNAGVTSLPRPHGIDQNQLIDLTIPTPGGTGPIDLHIPSFQRMAQLLRTASRRYGANAIANPKSGAYYYSP